MKRKPGIILATAAAVLFGAAAWGSIDTASADDFELAMVIKSTTNPYYNATLKGAQIAAEEIGGTAKNYGPTQSSGTGAGRHHQQPCRPPHPGDRGRAERSRCRRAGDEAGAEARRQGHHVRRRFRRRRTSVLRQPGDQRFDRPLRRRSCWSRPWAEPEGTGRDRLGAADGRQPECLDRGVQGRDVEIRGHRDRRYGLRLRQRAEGFRRHRCADHQVSRSRRHLRADLPRPSGRRTSA